MIHPITPCLWFDHNAEEAVAFYLGIFPNSRMLETARYPASEHPEHQRRAGSVMTIRFELNGQAYVALNGGPSFQLSEAVSFQVFCDTQQEIDHYWEKLSAGGDERARQCGWLKDKFGLSWQIVPSAIMELLGSGGDDRSARVMNALLGMKKLDIATLEAAAALTSITSTRVVTTSRSAIFAAIQAPERIARWWGPNGFTNTIHQFDFSPGGTWRLDMRGPDGTVYQNESRFMEIHPDQRVVLEHLGPVHHFILTITLSDGVQGTRIDWEMTFDNPEERAKAACYAPRCNEENFDRLEAELARFPSPV